MNRHPIATSALAALSTLIATPVLFLFLSYEAIVFLCCGGGLECQKYQTGAAGWALILFTPFIVIIAAALGVAAAILAYVLTHDRLKPPISN